MNATARQIDVYTATNIEIAKAIMQDVERHGGPESGLCRWASLVLQRAGEETPCRTRINASWGNGAQRRGCSARLRVHGGDL